MILGGDMHSKMEITMKYWISSMLAFSHQNPENQWFIKFMIGFLGSLWFRGDNKKPEIYLIQLWYWASMVDVAACVVSSKTTNSFNLSCKPVCDSRRWWIHDNRRNHWIHLIHFGNNHSFTVFRKTSDSFNSFEKTIEFLSTIHLGGSLLRIP